jgi:hypothetical protein
MTYTTPGQGSGWIAFWAGTALALGAAGIQLAAARRARRVPSSVEGRVATAADA